MRDPGFYDLLRYTLAVGNYLNGQGPKGGAYGFKLDILSKVDEVKSGDNVKNLMMYIIDKAETDRKKDLLD